MNRIAARMGALVVGLLLVSGCTEPLDSRSEGPRSGDEQPSRAKVEAAQWRRIQAPRPCACSDGSEFHYWVREGDPEKVLFYLHGGGACFSKDTCFTDPTFTSDLSGDSAPSEGIFDMSNPKNPFADYTVVAVPYCTGDLHLGTQLHDYGEGAVVRHVGAVNGVNALSATAAMFPRATEVVVAGGSAGAASSPLYSGLASDLFPDAEVLNIADAAGGYPANPVVTKVIGSLWGITSTIPAWTGAPSPDSDAWSLPGLAVQASKHDPDIRFVRLDYARDSVQEDFNELAGLTDQPLIDAISANEQTIRSAGADVMSWIADGEDHTTLSSDSFYSNQIGDVYLVDWIGRIVDGKKPSDQHCETCATVND